MKSRVFFDVVASIDGFIAPEGMDSVHANDPEYKQWASQWMKLQNCVFQQRFFRENLKLDSGGTEEILRQNVDLRQLLIAVTATTINSVNRDG